MSLKVAVIGLGHGSGYLHLIRENPRTELVAVVDKDPARLSNVTESQGVRGFQSSDELVAASLAAAAVIALPTQFHAEASTACLNAGLHVLQEKPLCRTDGEAEAIRQAAAESGRTFQVGYEVRSSPLHRAIMQHVADGDLGTLTNIWYNQHTFDSHGPDEWRQQRENMGGKLFDCAVHYFDLMAQWAGARVHRIVALGNLVGETGPSAQGLPKSAVVAIEYGNGVRGTYNFGAVNRFNDDASLGLAGTTGRIMGNPWLPEGAGSYELRLEGGLRRCQVVLDGNLTSRGHLGFTEQFGNFVSAVLDGAPNVCPIEDALATHRQMVAIDRSLATGEVVTLD